ncbi:hypothetical protein LOK49_LG08G01218 [Camellia lanceoleosa]|uniref:Uncharacterized protein n=1 Tax=Camellia lanceoleosa TaxID=1840588 RepID=A0ACC0GSR1_9ERIC|nr:hypothetical protein LOK49_LG08G01218 [Camellia lanceoleosa]
MKPVTPCKIALVVVFLFLFNSIVIEDIYGADEAPNHFSYGNFEAVEDGTFEEGDLIMEDYTRSQKKTPIHN